MARPTDADVKSYVPRDATGVRIPVIKVYKHRKPGSSAAELHWDKRPRYGQRLFELKNPERFIRRLGLVDASLTSAEDWEEIGYISSAFLCDGIAYVSYYKPRGDRQITSDTFIWAFAEGINSIHAWAGPHAEVEVETREEADDYEPPL